MGWVGEQPGGLNRYVDDLLKALAADDVWPRCVVVGDDNEDAPSAYEFVARRSDPLRRRLAAFAKRANQLAADADVVDVHFALNAGLSLRGRVGRMPMVAHFHGPYADEARAMGEREVVIRIKRLLERRVLKRAICIVTLSDAFASTVADDYGVDRSKIRVIRPGVDLDRFSPGDKRAAREQLGLPLEGDVVAVVRRLVPRMGIDVLLQAWQRLDTSNATLVIAGEGPERAALEGSVAGAHDVRFVGRLTDGELVALLRAADVMVVPSTELEGFGLVTLEALACGCPVIVTDAGGLAEVPRQLDASAVVAAADVGALARRLASWRDGSQPLRPAGECRAFAEQFSWTEVARAHRALYDEVANRPRVVVVTHTAQLGGAELGILRVINEARDRVDFHVIVGEAGPLVDRLASDGIAHEVIAMGGLSDLRRGRSGVGLASLRSGAASAGFVAKVGRRLRTLRPDVVHVNTLKAGVTAGVAARLAGFPVVWHVRDRVSPDAFPSSAARVLRQVIRRVATTTVVNSAATAEALALPEPPVVIPTPIDVDAFAAVEREPGGPMRAAVVGRLARWKGQDLFLRAFAAAFPSGDEVAVLIGGPLFEEEAFEAELKALAATLGIADRVEFRGQVGDVPAELRRIDIAVHCSVEPEPFGQVVVEAMAAGLAVIAAGEGGPATIVTNEVDGLLVQPRDAHALTTALRRLAEDPSTRARLGVTARRTASTYAPNRVVPQLVDLYRELARRGDEKH